MKYVLTVEIEGPEWPATPICDDIEDYLKAKGEGGEGIVGLADDYLINVTDGVNREAVQIRVKVKEIQ